MHIILTPVEKIAVMSNRLVVNVHHSKEKIKYTVCTVRRDEGSLYTQKQPKE